MANKGGQPKKKGMPRQKCGRIDYRKVVVPPTPQMEELRRRMLPDPKSDDKKVAHEVLSSSPVGLCLAWGLITVNQQRALERYANLVIYMAGRPFPTVPGTQKGWGSTEETERDQINEQRWRQAKAVLARYPSQIRSDVDNIAVYQRHPKWLQSVVYGRNGAIAARSRRYQIFRDAAESLAAIWGWSERKVA